ncbi:MAG: amidase [Candidimonas sp.]|nr:MAG: amidase [Candidimonas sp.]
MDDDLVWRPLDEQARLIRTGEASAKALAESYIARIGRFDPELKSFMCLNEQVVEQAARIDEALRRGVECGPLAGTCIAIKDNYLTGDLPTRVGTRVGELQFSGPDAWVVARLRDAGALVLGKTRMHEFAWGATTPPVRNPWNADCVPGGSSGGSAAALAAALCSAATGSDTGGSIRMPANLCGVAGIKPTFGLVSRGGVVPHSWSLDHAGPLSRTVKDSALLLDVITGADPSDPSSVAKRSEYASACGARIDGVRVAVIANYFTEDVSEDVQRCFDEALEWVRSEGLSIREHRVPSLRYGLAAIFAIELASASAWHDRAVQDGLTAGYTNDVRDLVDMGRFVTAVDYLHAEQIRTVMCREMAAIFSENDLILTPTMPIPAWRVDQDSVRIRGADRDVLASSWRFTFPFNLTGLPAMTVPAGFSSDGLPIGLQIVGKPYAEREVFRVAHAFEQSHGWRTARPPRFS